MSKRTTVWLKEDQMAGIFRGRHPLSYETNLETVENIIRHWNPMPRLQASRRLARLGAETRHTRGSRLVVRWRRVMVRGLVLGSGIIRC